MHGKVFACLGEFGFRADEFVVGFGFVLVTALVDLQGEVGRFALHAQEFDFGGDAAFDHGGGAADLFVKDTFALLQAGDGFIQRFAPCFVGAGFAVAQFFGDDVGEFERFVVGFAAVARQHGFEVDDFGFAFTQDGGAAGIVDGDEDVTRFDLVAFFDVQLGEDAGVEALDDLQAAAGDDGSLAARDFFKFVVVGPDDESGEEGSEEEDAPP